MYACIACRDLTIKPVAMKWSHPLKFKAVNFSQRQILVKINYFLISPIN